MKPITIRQSKRAATRGFALITAVMVGAILVIIVATGASYLLGSSSLTTAQRTGERADNAARAGLAAAISEFDTGAPMAVATTDVPFDQAEYAISVKDVSDEGYVIEAVGTLPNGTARKVLRTLIQPQQEDWGRYAIAAKGDVSLQNHSFVASLPETGKGDVRSNDSVSLMKHSSVWGSVMAVNDVTTDSKSHAWGGATFPYKSLKFPAYTRNQIQAFVDDAKAVKSVLIGTDALEAGTLDGHYYSYADYDVMAPQTNGATLKLSKGSYTLSGTVFVAGKLQIENHVTITGEGRIIATEGITAKKHFDLVGSTLTSHTDLVSLYGNIEIRNHAVLGQISTGLKGRKLDDDDGNDSDDDDYKFGADDLLWADKRDADLLGADKGSKDSDDDHDNGAGNDDKDKDKNKDKNSLLPWRTWLAMALPALDQALVPPAFAKKDDEDDDGGSEGGDADKNKDDKGDDDKVKKGKSGDLSHGKDWKKKYKGAIPVGCTIFAMQGNVKLSKHVTLIGNIIAGGNVELWNHADVVRNSVDPVQSVGIFSWKSTSVQSVN